MTTTKPAIQPEAQNWINLAQEDYDSSLYLFKGARYPGSIYFMGQAIEKITKPLNQ